MTVYKLHIASIYFVVLHFAKVRGVYSHKADSSKAHSRITILGLVILLLTLALPPITHAQESVRDWTNSEGKTIQADFVRLDGNTLVIKDKGKQFKVELSRLSAKSQALAKKLAKKQAASMASQTPAQPKIASPGPTIDPAQLDPVLLKALNEHNIPLREDIVSEIQKGIEFSKSRIVGHVVVGQLQIPDSLDTSDLICQANILPDGYFVDIVRTCGAPIWIWHRNYKAAHWIPRDKAKPFEWLGKIQLEKSRDRFACKGIARSGYYKAPAKGQITAKYALSFVNTFLQREEKKKALEERLTALSTPEIRLDNSTGFFQVENLVDAPITLKIRDGESKYDDLLFPGKSEILDLGVCILEPEYASEDGPIPLISKLTPAAAGREDLDLLLKQVEQKSGTTPNGVRFHERLANQIFSLITEAEKWNKRHGERSAVVFVAPIHVASTNMDLLTTHLSLTPAYYTEANQTQTVPRIVYGIVKPGTTVSLTLPGFEPLEYQTKGSPDGIECVDNLTFDKPNRRLGSMEVVDSNQNAGIHLMYDAFRYTRTNGTIWSRPRTVSIRNGSVSPSSIPSGTSRKSTVFRDLPAGPYAMTWSAGEEFCPRQIGFELKPGKKLRIPKIETYPVLKAELEFSSLVHSDRNDKSTKSFRDNTVNRKVVRPNTRDWPVRFETSSSPYFTSNTLEWIAKQNGNTLLLTPFYSIGTFGSSAPSRTWSVLRLGIGDLKQFQGFESTIDGSLKLANTVKSPLRLTSGYTYFLQSTDSRGFPLSILVKVD